jgi:hypothetical protein
MISNTMVSHPTSTIQRRTIAKQKKSFTLSRSSVAFLTRLRKERNAPSTSLVLDQLIQEADACQRRNSAEQAISAYYNSLSDDEKREQEAWGEFAIAQLKQEPK